VLLRVGIEKDGGKETRFERRGFGESSRESLSDSISSKALSSSIKSDVGDKSVDPAKKVEERENGEHETNEDCEGRLV
jgi:hypothetical protein